MDFDPIAPMYDRLASLVFGHSLDRAKCELFHLLPSNGKILMLGGGTGKTLTYLHQQRPELDIYFLEASAKMLDLARKRTATKAHFIHGSDIDQCLEGHSFQAILTPFVLDLYEGKKLDLLIRQINEKLEVGGIWIHTDFFLDQQHKSLWRKLLVFAMYLFFRIVSKIKTRKLENAFEKIEKQGLEEIESQYFYAELVRTTSYKK